MDKIRIKNIRSIVDSGVIDLAPLTILLGKNSSGKSTFLRMFPLLKQSWNTKNRGVLALYGDFVDFGEFKSMITSDTSDNYIEIDFDVNIAKSARYAYIIGQPIPDKKIPCTCRLQISNSENIDFLYCSSIEIELNDNTINININSDGKIINFIINGYNFNKYCKNTQAVYNGNSTCFPYFIDNSKNLKSSRYSPYPTIFLDPLLENISLLEKEKEFEIFQLLNLIPFSDKDRLAKIFRQQKFSDIHGELIAHALESPDKGEYCLKTILFALVPSLLENIRTHLFSMSQNIFYSKPLRANAERYYRSQSLAVDEISPDGSNLASFIANMTYGQKYNFDLWTKNNFGFIIKIHREYGHQSVCLVEKESGPEFNVTDMGFGFSQIIPIITQLWSISNNHEISVPFYCNDFIYAIEQPELHLHPALQAKTLRLFSEVIKFAMQHKVNLKIIIETHSETIINYLGKLIANGKFNANDVSLLIFDKENSTSNTIINKSSYTDKGVLKNWPFGFFSTDDEF